MDAKNFEIRQMRQDEVGKLVDAQNEIFADYIVPMRSSREFFLEFLESVGGSISNVIIALDSDRIIGYVNPVLDGKEAWIGGVGVVPHCRGAGLGRRLMDAAEALCLAKGAEEVVLEVIVGNEKAMNMYNRLGYSTTGTYISAEGRPQQFAGFGFPSERTSLAELTELHRRCYSDSCWQRRKFHGLKTAARNSECYSTDGGFVMLRRVESSGYMPYLGVVPEERRQGIGTSLMKFALNRLWELGVYRIGLYNLNDDIPVLRLLDKFDFKVTLKQTEMRKRLV